MQKRTPKKILVIDDDKSTIKILEICLGRAGYDIIGVYNGKDGLKEAIAQLPDLILSDVVLPDIGGIDLAKSFRSNPKTKDIPLIFITVTVGVELDKGEETLEVDGCLYRVFAKPLHHAKLLSEIRKSINRRIHDNKFFIKGS